MGRVVSSLVQPNSFTSIVYCHLKRLNAECILIRKHVRQMTSADVGPRLDASLRNFMLITMFVLHKKANDSENFKDS